MITLDTSTDNVTTLEACLPCIWKCYPPHHAKSALSGPRGDVPISGTR